MNIFVLDIDPVISARYHCDRHVTKMVLETAQILSTAHRLNGSVVERLYRATHIRHPVVKWVNYSQENYEWTYEMFIALADEYQHRYHRKHASYVGLKDLLQNPPETLEPLGLSQFALAMPEIYRQPDAVQAYRQYYCECKLKFATWRDREVPYWVKEYQTGLSNRPNKPLFK